MEDFSCSEKTAGIATALAAVQAAGLKPHKNASNPHFKSKYADLEQVLDTARSALNKHDLSLIQMPLGGVDVCRLLIRVQHGSGEYFQWIFTTPVSKKDPQGIGAAITYLRRFSLVSVFNMVDSDDDGNTASERGVPETTFVPNPGASASGTRVGVSVAPAPQVPSAFEQGKKAAVAKQAYSGAKRYPISEPQLKRLYAINRKTYSEDELKDYIFSRWGLSSLKDLVKNEYEALIELIESQTLTVEKEEPPLPTEMPYEDIQSDGIPF